MHAIFDAPMTSYRVGKGMDFFRKAEYVIACLFGDILTDVSLGLNHPDAFQSLPCPFFIQIGNMLWIINDPMSPDLKTTMSFFDGFIESVLDVSKLISLSKVKGLLNFFGKRPLIAFERQDIVSLLVDDLCGNLHLCPHCIKRYNTAGKRELFQEQGNSNNFI